MSEPNTCLNCGRSSQQRHLLAGEFQGNPFFICADCLPYLIHQPETVGQAEAGPTDKD